ncbi:MAG: hypothetical protein ACT4SY_12660 [Hyphomicrobiales bacterium]
MPSRTQVTIEPELRRRALKKAERQGISFAEYVRRAIAKDLGGEPQPLPVSAVFDLGRSRTATDIGRDKHRMIAEALEREGRRK